jgi:N-acetyl-anhydromuramyl-L-alanine amidase AmpD
MSEMPLTSPGVYHKGSGSNLPVHRVVIHTTESDCVPGGSINVAHYFATPQAGGSAHYIVDPTNTQHGASDSTICWHAPPNQNSIGIEITAHSGSTNWASPNGQAALHRAAALAAKLCHTYGIPLVKLSSSDLVAGKHGICGHVDVSQAFHQSSHTDPGSNFPWGQFMGLVKGSGSVTPPSPVRPPTPASHPVLKEGSRGAAVMTLQRLLHISSDGIFGPATKAAVVKFQKAHGLSADGIVGPATWGKLV